MSGVPKDVVERVLRDLEAIDCQFIHCEGPDVEPEDMLTCHRCWAIHELRVAGVT